MCFGCCESTHSFCLLFPKLALFSLVGAVLLGYEASSDVLGIFNNTVGELSDKYEFEITPADWTFFIWGVIYVYQGIWIIYGISLFCRRNPVTGKRLYCSPPFMPGLIYIVMIINFGCNIAWLFLWDDRKLWLGVFALCGVTGTLYVAMGISMYNLNRRIQIIVTQGIEKEIGLVIGLVHNGLGMYATWASIATLLNTGIALVHEEPRLKQTTASSLILGALAVEILTWVVLDNTLFAKYTRYLFTPYVVLLWALIGTVSKIWDVDEPVALFAGAVLLLALVGAMIKVLLIVCRKQKQRKRRSSVVYEKEVQPFVFVINDNKSNSRHLVGEML